MSTARRRAGALLAAVLCVLGLWSLGAAMRTGPSVTGTVTLRFPVRNITTHRQYYYLTIRQGSGVTRTYRVGFPVFMDCPRGAHYPACRTR